MDDALYLELTDYEDDAHWRWVLNDANGRYLADHVVNLEEGDRYLRGFRDPAAQRPLPAGRDLSVAPPEGSKGI